jgi:hypothetical protein
MQVEVATRERSGDRLPQLAQSTPAYATSVFRSLDEIAAGRVKAIIAANEPTLLKPAQLSREQSDQAADSRAELIAEHLKSTGRSPASLL